MSIETRPDVRNLDDAQRTLAMAHWYLWLVAQTIPHWNNGDTTATLMWLERDMQPETRLRLAQARGRYEREVKLVANS